MPTLLCRGCDTLTNTAFVPLSARIYEKPAERPDLDYQAHYCAARIVEHENGTARVERGCGYDRCPDFMKAFAQSAIAEQPYSAEAIARRNAAVSQKGPL